MDRSWEGEIQGEGKYQKESWEAELPRVQSAQNQ